MTLSAVPVTDERDPRGIAGARQYTTVTSLTALGGHCMKVQKSLGYEDTPILPHTRFRVHDDTRPQPRLVSPGTAGTQEQPGEPPSDAIRLFGGTDLSH